VVVGVHEMETVCRRPAGRPATGRHAPAPTAQTPELDALLSIADYATANYADILDRGNLKDVEVLKELVRKSVARLDTTSTPKSLASASTKSGEWSRRRRCRPPCLALPFLWPSS
jgi:hypothetical protein